MTTCYSCNKPLNRDNHSKEHILPNGIGGRLYSKKLLCKTCNSQFGDSIDAALMKQLQSLVSLLGVKKQRGELQPIKGLRTLDGEQVDIIDGRTPAMPKPEFHVTNNPDGTKNYKIRARNEAELRQILTGLSRKHKLDVEQALKSAKHDQHFLRTPVQMSIGIGGEESRRALVKSAINYFLLSGGERQYVSWLIDYVKGNGVGDMINPYIMESFLYEIQENEVVHLIHIEGNPQSRILFCYVELFSAFSYLILLSKDYDGMMSKHTHCVNPITGKEVTKEVNIEPPPELLTGEQVLSYMHPEIMTEKLKRVQNIIQSQHWDKSVDEAIHSSMDNAFKDIPEGGIIDEKAVRSLTEELSMKLALLIYSQQPKNDNTH